MHTTDTGSLLLLAQLEHFEVHRPIVALAHFTNVGMETRGLRTGPLHPRLMLAVHLGFAKGGVPPSQAEQLGCVC